MKVYYINSVDYNSGSRKVSLIFSSKELAVQYLYNKVLPKSTIMSDDNTEDKVEIKVNGNEYTADITRTAYNKDGSYYNSWSWMNCYEVVEEDLIEE